MGMDEFVNSTQNQHFVSQAEQRLNSCSKDPASKKAEIYCFNIEGKEPPQISLNGRWAIWRNLSFHDLFTILRTPEKERVNLESLFGRYEEEFSNRVTSLLDRIGRARSMSGNESERIDLKAVKDCDFSGLLDDVKFIYKYKMMVGIRNPYKIKDTLRDFQFILNYSLYDPVALKLYVALEMKNKSEESRICEIYNISSQEYREWIRLLIFFLYIQKKGNTILDGLIDEFFEAKEYATNILIHVFESGCALLPDTGVVKDGLVTYMNVAKNCIVALEHIKIDEHFFFDEICKQNKLSDDCRMKLIEELGKTVVCFLYINKDEILAGYNKICVKAAAKQVFSGASEIAGIEVIEKARNRS